MLIQDAAKKHPAFNVPTPLGEHLIGTGQFVAFKQTFYSQADERIVADQKPAPQVDVRWSIIGAGTEGEPYAVYAKCFGCGCDVRFNTLDLKRLEKQEFRHTHNGKPSVEQVPMHIIAELAWRKKRAAHIREQNKASIPNTRPTGGLAMLIK